MATSLDSSELTSLDQLHITVDMLRHLVQLDDEGFAAALEAGFVASPPEPPERAARLSSVSWANAFLVSIADYAQVLQNRLDVPPSFSLVEIRASESVDPEEAGSASSDQ